MALIAYVSWNLCLKSEVIIKRHKFAIILNGCILKTRKCIFSCFKLYPFALRLFPLDLLLNGEITALKVLVFRIPELKEVPLLVRFPPLLHA